MIDYYTRLLLRYLKVSCTNMYSFLCSMNLFCIVEGQLKRK